MLEPAVITAHRNDWVDTARQLARRPAGWVATRIDTTATHHSYLVSPRDRVVVMLTRTPDALAEQLRRAGFRLASTSTGTNREVWYDPSDCSMLEAA